jgi:uncharacterized membrane protein YccF (DUF307 family)
LFFLILAALFTITIVGIPLGKALLQFAKLSAFPFGKEIINEENLKGEGSVSGARSIGGTIVNLIWLQFGIIMSIIFIFSGIFAFITIIFIPVGVVYVRMGKFLIWPIGAKVVSKKQAYALAVANELENRK